MSMWELRAGLVQETTPMALGASLYVIANSSETSYLSDEAIIRFIDGGNRSMIVPLTSFLVSDGKTKLAEIYWRLQGYDLPATRSDLLDALAWFGRHELYTVMALKPEIPEDMIGDMFSEQCAAVCHLGWMTTRQDGLFHGDELVSYADIRILSSFLYIENPQASFLSVSSLENLSLLTP